MPDPYDLIRELTASTSPANISSRLLRDFAVELGWRPSYQLDIPEIRELANAHLVVEHGLENSAVITFLRQPWVDLTLPARKSILSISYNNLVDWHIQVQSNQVLFVFNRTKPERVVADHNLQRTDVEYLRSTAFEQIIGKRPNPNLPALDDALISTISYWKRNLSAEMGYSISNADLSALFNAIIFVRATEDHYRHRVLNQLLRTQTLLDTWHALFDLPVTLRQVLRTSLDSYVENCIPAYVLNDDRLSAFDTLERTTVSALLADFYSNSYYDYDFSLISKHALSRIYEHYVSVLRLEEVSPTNITNVSTTSPGRTRQILWRCLYSSVYCTIFRTLLK